MDPKTTPSQVLIRVLAKKPGWKDTNFQVNIKLKLLEVVILTRKTLSVHPPCSYVQTHNKD